MRCKARGLIPTRETRGRAPCRGKRGRTWACGGVMWTAWRALPQPCCHRFRVHRSCAMFGVAIQGSQPLRNGQPQVVGAGGEFCSGISWIDPRWCPLWGAAPDGPGVRPTLLCPALLVTCLLLLSLQQPQSPDRSNRGRRAAEAPGHSGHRTTPGCQEEGERAGEHLWVKAASR